MSWDYVQLFHINCLCAIRYKKYHHLVGFGKFRVPNDLYAKKIYRRMKKKLREKILVEK